MARAQAAAPTTGGLETLPGVGPARRQALAAAGFESVADLLFQPTRPIDPAPDELTGDGPLPRGQAVQVRARCQSSRVTGFGRRRVLEVRFATATEQPLAARFFNAMWLRDKLVPGEWYLLEGRSDQRRANTLNQPRFTHLAAGDSDDRAARSGCRVSYAIPAGFGDRSWRALVDAALDHGLASLRDPAGRVSDAELQHAVRDWHRPPDRERHADLRRFFAEREALALAWHLQARREQVVAQAGRAWTWSDRVHERALRRLPFALTSGQQQALAEIRADLRAPQPMYRLLQGDVGSGKTALALVAALAVIAERAQAVLLAPTAILAGQHHRFVASCLHDSRVRFALLTGATPADERRRLLASWRAGELDLLIGTHALLEEEVRAHRLGLAIIDEQHKFGVEQRARLLAGAGTGRPDLLAMTATPIPRTLALTAFGDLAVSDIAGRPPGRGTVTTEVTAQSDPTLERELAVTLADDGRAFVVCPLRGESERVAASDVVAVHARLAARFGAERVALVHGALSEADKHRALAEFRDGDARILVGTTVIEVGIDVAAATAMVVLDADRFGLAQLHQLRGRIGRGARPGRCLLMARTPEARERLAILAASDDGLQVAEADLRQRGPGALLGTRQHGISDLRFLDPLADLDLLQAAHRAVAAAAAAGRRPAPELLRLVRADVITAA